MIQEHYIYFYYHYISSTSDHRVLDPGDWGLLTHSTWQVG